MRVGVPGEVKNNERRVALLPGGARALARAGHEVLVQAGAGEGVGVGDGAYREAGARILPGPEEVFGEADLIVKVKEPQPEEAALLSPRHTLFAFLHLAADRPLTEALMSGGAACVAYETVQGPGGSLPLLTPMSEVAGRMAPQVGFHHLQSDRGGKGVLPGGVGGAPPARVAVLGCGAAGGGAIDVALGMGASVTGVDISGERLAEVRRRFGGRAAALPSDPETVAEAVARADLVVGSVLVPGAKAPRLVTREMVRRMEPGSVAVDVAVDQGGCLETSRPTTHEDPTFTEDGVVHYCVSNIPGAVARTSTHALTAATLPYVLKIADGGLACDPADMDPALKSGVNVLGGRLVHRRVARDLGLPFHELG